MANGLRFSTASLILLSFSGCAIYTPFEVVRFWADYNTERECNFQAEVIDHLPPKTVQVKLMRWGYNVGPPGGPVPPPGPPANADGTWWDRMMPSAAPMPDPQFNPGPGNWNLWPAPSKEPVPETMPPVPPPPPAPAAEPPEPDDKGRPGTNNSASRQTRRNPAVDEIQQAAGTDGEAPAGRVANAAWLFTSGSRARK